HLFPEGEPHPRGGGRLESCTKCEHACLRHRLPATARACCHVRAIASIKYRRTCPTGLRGTPGEALRRCPPRLHRSRRPPTSRCPTVDRQGHDRIHARTERSRGDVACPRTHTQSATDGRAAL